jgi:UDP-N-acetylmuramoyl-L-alanyl-D-glutamate--2,6-diaminopimelate ligase
MKLKTLLKGMAATIKGKDVEVNGISADSRTVAPGNLFVAVRGGVDFVPMAVEAGASAVVTDLYDPFVKVTQVIVARVEEAVIASRFYGEPSKELFVVGVTGSKGKTTTSYMIHHVLSALHGRAGLMSTVETVVGEERKGSTLTTHGAVANQKILREMVAKGCKSVVIEVSSHGLDQGRVDEIDFDWGVFTNLYPDHLDYHGTVEEYAKAKKKLFAVVGARAILNGDSAWSKEMGSGVTFGIEQAADIRATGIEFGPEGTKFLVNGVLFQIPLMGRFNVYNALGAIGVGLQQGATLERLAEILRTFRSAPGRLQRVPNGKGAWVFVDYSHTGPALENVLGALKEVAPKRVICVFGCGGNRDPLRRVEMAAAAEKYADVSIVTTDNPRKEDPVAICEEIRRGFSTKLPLIILNRKEAIERALELAGKDDIVLIAGKGHEKVQIFAHQTVPFDDVEVASSLT